MTRIRLLGDVSLLGASPVELEFPTEPLAICLGPNGSGKSLIACAVRVCLLPDATIEDRHQLREAGLRRIELDLTADGQSATVALTLEDERPEVSVDFSQTVPEPGSTNGGEPGRQGSEWLLARIPAFAHGIHLTVNGESRVPDAADVDELILAIQRPVRRELESWRSRMTALVGVDGESGRRADAKDAREHAVSELKRRQTLESELEDNRRRQNELNLELTELITGGAVLKLERDEIDRTVGLAERGARLENWLGEIRAQGKVVEGLREEHSEAQEKLDQLSTRFRGSPDNLPAMLEHYTELNGRQDYLNREREVMLAARSQGQEEIREIEEELDALEKPDLEGVASRRLQIHAEMQEAETELMGLLRDRIQVLRQRDGIEQQLQAEYAAFASLDATGIEALRSFSAAEPANATESAEPIPEHPDLQSRRQRADAIRRQLRESFLGFDRLSSEVEQELGGLFDTRASLARASRGLEELHRRRSNLESSDPTRKRVLICGAAALIVGVPVGIGWAWDIGLFGALVGGGLTLLGLRYANRERESRLDAIIAEQDDLQEQWRAALNAKAMLESGLGPLAAAETLQEAKERLAEYRALLDELQALDRPVPDERAFAPARSPLPAGFESITREDLRERLAAYDELINRRVDVNHRWQLFEENGERAQRIEVLESTVSRKRREIEKLEAAGDQARTQHETRQKMLLTKLEELRERIPDESAIQSVEEELTRLEADLERLAEESGGVLIGVNPATIRHEWEDLQSVRVRLRELKDALSARLSFDEIRSRQAILADELRDVQDKLTERDPLFGTQGDAAHYLKKYSDELDELSGKIAENLRNAEETRSRIDSVNIQAIEEELSALDSRDVLESALRDQQRRLEDVEREAATTREIIASMEHEIRDIERNTRADLEDAANRHLQSLDATIGRLKLHDEGWMVERPEGGRRRLSALSRGTGEVVRMILAAGVLELTESAEQMMVVWDDLFANLDDAHLDFVRGLISAISARRQVIVTTRDLRLGEWGACIDLEQAFRHLELSPQA